MKNICLIIALTTLFSCASSQKNEVTVKNKGNLTEYRSAGSLASKYDLNCIALTEVKRLYTPADLYKASRKCVDINDYQASANLFSLAGLYAKYDAKRVTDKSAGQARRALISKEFSSLTQEKKQKFGQAIKLITKDKVALANLCIEVKRINKPQYYPDYMILHGMKAFLGEPHKNAMVSDFDETKEWNLLLDEYLHCPKEG